MALMGKIRGMHFRDGKPISEIARLTSLSRNTIKKWLKAPQGAQPRYQRRDGPTKLTPFVAVLTQALEVDAHRAKRERRSARALHAQLKDEGYDGGYTGLTDFIRQWRHERDPRLHPVRLAWYRIAFGIVVLATAWSGAVVWAG